MKQTNKRNQFHNVWKSTVKAKLSTWQLHQMSEIRKSKYVSLIKMILR